MGSTWLSFGWMDGWMDGCARARLSDTLIAQWFVETCVMLGVFTDVRAQVAAKHIEDLAAFYDDLLKEKDGEIMWVI